MPKTSLMSTYKKHMDIIHVIMGLLIAVFFVVSFWSDTDYFHIWFIYDNLSPPLLAGMYVIIVVPLLISLFKIKENARGGKPKTKKPKKKQRRQKR